MKFKLLKELLFEMTEVIDRHSNYGTWIDARNKKVYPIKTNYGHEDFIHRNIDKLEVPPNANGFLEVAFHNHFIRISHQPSHQINIQGRPEDIKNIAKILIASIVQPDVDSIYIDKVGSNSEQFTMPHERSKASRFIQNA